ncbi:MAG: NosD domain-containing protein, partial [Candidatus Thermoplasmatota archaeon]|nr:NosD domain-containing protein [Candidatus Thermoplasmatota archaeon]
MIKTQKLLLLVTILMALLVIFSGCNDIFINESKTLYVDDEPGKDFTSIQAAIDAAKPSWTVFVYDGFYNEALFINKSVNLVGLSPENTFILPKNVKSNDNCTIFINADGCTIKNFDISFEGEKSENIGIRISSSNNTIFNNTFSNFKYGIYFFSNEILFNNNVSNNKITDCNYGLYGRTDLKFNVFFNNNIKNNENGIEFYSAVNSTISGNNISFNSMYGIYITGDSDGNV